MKRIKYLQWNQILVAKKAVCPDNSVAQQHTGDLKSEASLDVFFKRFSMRRGTERLQYAEPSKSLQVILTEALTVNYGPFTITEFRPRFF